METETVLVRLPGRCGFTAVIINHPIGPEANRRQFIMEAMLERFGPGWLEAGDGPCDYRWIPDPAAYTIVDVAVEDDVETVWLFTDEAERDFMAELTHQARHLIGVLEPGPIVPNGDPTPGAPKWRFLVASDYGEGDDDGSDDPVAPDNTGPVVSRLLVPASV